MVECREKWRCLFELRGADLVSDFQLGHPSSGKRSARRRDRSREPNASLRPFHSVTRSAGRPAAVDKTAEAICHTRMLAA